MKTIEQLKQELLEKIALNKAAAQEKMQVAKLTTKIKMLDNEDYVDSLVKTDNKLQNIENMKATMAILTSLPPVKTETGVIKTRVYPSGKAYFGEEFSYFLGLVNGLNGLFMDDHITTGYAAAGTNVVAVENTKEAFGTPAYWSNRDKVLVPQRIRTFEGAKVALEQLASDMELDIDFSRFTHNTYKAYFENESLKATNKQLDYQKGQEAGATKNEDGEGKLRLTSSEPKEA